MQQVAKLIIFAGLSLVVIGGVVWVVSSLFPGFKLGQLPGDIKFQKGGTTVYFPIVTMLLASVLFSTILWLISWIRK